MELCLRYSRWEMEAEGIYSIWAPARPGVITWACRSGGGLIIRGGSMAEKFQKKVREASERTLAAILDLQTFLKLTFFFFFLSMFWL